MHRFIWTVVVQPTSAPINGYNQNTKACWVSFSMRNDLPHILAFNKADYGKENNS